jgi:hypothetical protein
VESAACPITIDRRRCLPARLDRCTAEADPPAAECRPTEADPVITRLTEKGTATENLCRFENLESDPLIATMPPEDPDQCPMEEPVA